MTMLSERFLYLPVLGLAFAGGVLARDAGRVGRRGAAGAAVAACLAALALGTIAVRRSSDFQDEERFWARELALHPDSLEALRFHVQAEMEKKHFARALDYVARAEKVAARDFPQTGHELDFIVHGVQLLLATIPDHDEDSLRRTGDFLDAVSSGVAPAAVLDTGAIHIRLPLGGKTIAKRVEKQRPRILALRAGIESRLSKDDDAMALAERALALCPGCMDVGRAAALVAARAGSYERARTIVDGVARGAGEPAIETTRKVIASAERLRNEATAAPAGAVRLQLRATELCTLEAWGRAFDVLAPAKSDIEKAPDFALGFAELAWRAGEFKVARDVIGDLDAPRSHPPNDARMVGQDGVDRRPRERTRSPASSMMATMRRSLATYRKVLGALGAIFVLTQLIVAFVFKTDPFAQWSLIGTIYSVFFAPALAGAFVIHAWARPRPKELGLTGCLGVAIAAAHRGLAPFLPTNAHVDVPVVANLFFGLGLASLLFAGVRAARSKGDERDAWLSILLPGALLPAFVGVSTFFLGMTAFLHPLVYDASVFVADAPLGWQPSFACGRLFAATPYLPVVCRIVYWNLPLALAVVYAARHKERTRAELRRTPVVHRDRRRRVFPLPPLPRRRTALLFRKGLPDDGAHVDRSVARVPLCHPHPAQLHAVAAHRVGASPLLAIAAARADACGWPRRRGSR